MAKLLAVHRRVLKRSCAVWISSGTGGTAFSFEGYVTSVRVVVMYTGGDAKLYEGGISSVGAEENGVLWSSRVVKDIDPCRSRLLQTLTRIRELIRVDSYSHLDNVQRGVLKPK
ncbi:hypothetical protein DFH06DRAFT_1291403 [Mycena polygramma]|nr:hypothetical protein DFH06DRAFT_1291403 [Mycena polygramma]